MMHKAQKAEPRLISQKGLKSLRELASGNFNFRANLAVSSQSVYGDDVWCWVDRNNKRLKTYDSVRLTINWLNLKLNYDLTDDILTDLKRFTFIRAIHPAAFVSGQRLISNVHPATLVNGIKAVVLFLAHLRRQLSGPGYSLVSKLSDIEIEDISDALSTYAKGQRQIIKNVLMYLGSPMIQNLFHYGPLKWNETDIKNLCWNIKRKEPYERLPDDLFRFLSNTATSDVKQSLLAMNIVPLDKTKLGEGPNHFLLAVPNFKNLHDEHVQRLTEYRYGCRSERKKGRAPIKVKSQYSMWCRRVGGIEEFGKLIERARKAAQLLIAMYTGARLSELDSLEIGCVRRRDEGWVLVGTQIKKKGLDSPVSQDEWVAIPIVLDAVRLLEETAVLTESRDLFRSTKANGDSRATGSRSGRFTYWFNKYLEIVDAKEEWKNYQLHAHKFRHTLVFQMRRAGLNLPFITYQLKHSYDALNRRLNNVTLSYGSISGEAAQKAIQDANLELVKQLYHPDAPVAGGGAEEHKARRATFFQGMALGGAKVDEVLKQLAKQGMPLTDVGLGLCQGQRKIVKDGVKEDPPCIGQLRCNPVRCQNGIIPLYKISAWKRISTENRQRLNDPEFAHAAKDHEEAANEADTVVQYLETQKHKFINSE